MTQNEITASSKQLEYVKKLAAWKGQAIDFNGLANKSVAEVSVIIDQLKALKSAKAEEKPAEKTQPEAIEPKTQWKEDFNKVRFGLACKVALQRASEQVIFPDQEKFNKLVALYYNTMMKAEEAFSSSSSPSEVRK